MKSSLARFILLVLAWLPVTFVVWYVLAPVLLWPVQLVCAAVARLGFPDLVRAVEAHGSTLSFVTTLKPGSAEAGGILTVDVNMLLYAFGLPLFVALTLAARERAWWRPLAIGYVAMLPFIAWGVLADFLKNVAITSSTLVASQTGFGPIGRDIIAFAYQFGSLILPAVVPAVAWVLTHRAFLERMRAARRRADAA
ncbi:MAG: exosortase H-associated membrane protein [Burkholderiales bacterium]